MITSGRLATVGLSEALAWAGAVGRPLSRSCCIWSATDVAGEHDRPRVRRAGALAAIAWMRRPRPAAGLAAHAAYVASLLVVFVAAGGPDASRELWRQATFVAVRRAAAPAVPRGALIGVHVGCLLLVWLARRAAVGYDTVGRAGFYHALEHWSGYPSWAC
jgi:hypothetical protein